MHVRANLHADCMLKIPTQSNNNFGMLDKSIFSLTHLRCWSRKQCQQHRLNYYKLLRLFQRRTGHDYIDTLKDYNPCRHSRRILQESVKSSTYVTNKLAYHSAYKVWPYVKMAVINP